MEQLQAWVQADNDQADACDWFAAVTDDEARKGQLQAQAEGFRSSAAGWQEVAASL